MFSAKNARDLKKSFEKSTVEVAKITSRIEGEIHRNHKTTQYFHQMGSAPRGKYVAEILTTEMTDIAHGLGVLGYSVVWQWANDPYVPIGSQDDDGNGPEFDRFGSLITWGE